MLGKHEDYNKSKKCRIVDYLTPVVLVFYVVPLLLKRHPKNWSAWYISNSRLGGLLLGLVRRISHWDIQRLEFRLVDVRDANDILVKLRITHGGEFSQIIEEIIQGTRPVDRFPNSASFWRKCLAEDVSPNTANTSLASSMFLIQVAAWQARGSDNCTMLLGDRAWWGDLQRYAAKFGVDLVRVSKGYNRYLSKDYLIDVLKEKLSENTIRRMKNLRCRWTKFGKQNRLGTVNPLEPNLLTEYMGHLNLEDGHLHSDLFFWQQSSLKGEDIVVSFSSQLEPLNEEMLEQCRRHLLNLSVSQPQASGIDHFPIFDYKPLKKALTLQIETKSATFRTSKLL